MEEWKTVVINGETYDNYEVSTQGRVRSLNFKRTGEIKIMKPHMKKSGYLYINLHKNGKSKYFQVHRLVATMFIPNPDNKPTVNHIDEDKTNNCVDNLEWATQKEQVHHGTVLERRAKARSGKGKRVKCLETGQEWDTVRQASKETGLHESNIAKCCRRTYETCGGFHWRFVD